QSKARRRNALAFLRSKAEVAPDCGGTRKSKLSSWMWTLSYNHNMILYASQSCVYNTHDSCGMIDHKDRGIMNNSLYLVTVKVGETVKDKFLRNYMKYEISRGTQVKIRRFKSHNWYASRRPQSSPGVVRPGQITPKDTRRQPDIPESNLPLRG
ncbi:unnamed protein product, partial [Nesidiocoris tenuis]